MPGTSPRGPRWKWRWRGALPPTPQALFPLYWEEQSPRICKWVWCKTSRPPQFSYLLDTSSALTTDSKSVIRNQGKRWNLGDLCTNDLKFLGIYVFVFMKNGEIDSEWEQRKSWPFVLGKWESESFLKADRTKQTRGWLSKEHSHADVSSFCICYFFHCPRTTPKAKSSSSHNNTKCDNALLCGANVIFRMGAGCLHSTGELLRGTVKPSSITFSFSCPALTGAGSVGQSSWRLIPFLQLWQRSCSPFILFLTHITMWQSEDLWDDQQTSSLRCFWRPCHAELPFCLASFLSTFTGCKTNC